MISLIEPTQLKNSLGEDGILFVRNDCIFDTMVKIPLLVASMIIVAALLPNPNLHLVLLEILI